MRVGPFIAKQWGERLSFLTGRCQFSLSRESRGWGWAEIIAGLLKEILLLEPIMRGWQGLSFCKREEVCLHAWVLWG